MKWNTPKLAFLFFILLVTLSGLLNIGFIGTDEYTEGIERYIPAQQATWDKLVHADDVKSPTQISFFHYTTKALYSLGIHSAELQYRGMILILGLLSALLIAWGLLTFYTATELPAERNRRLSFAFYFFCFHFAIIGLLPRPMFESLSMPLIFAALALAHRYDQKPQLTSLLGGVLLGSLAFCARPQSGAINLVFFLIPLFHRRWRDLAIVSLVGLGCFALAGLPDLFIRSDFHYSLKAVLFYNLKNGGAYNPKPWWFYFPLIFALVGGMFLFSRYSKETWDRVRQSRSFWLGAILFVLCHLAFSNKFERFMIPILPILLVLVLPLWYELWQKRQEHKWRWTLVFALNFLIWPVSSFFTSQANALNLCFYLNQHKEIQDLTLDLDTFSIFPGAFIERPMHADFVNRVRVLESLTESAQSMGPTQYWVLAKKDYTDWQQSHSNLVRTYKIEAEFDPNLIEKLAFLMNPTKNYRRQTIYLIKKI